MEHEKEGSTWLDASTCTKSSLLWMPFWMASIGTVTPLAPLALPRHRACLPLSRFQWHRERLSDLSDSGPGLLQPEDGAQQNDGVMQ